MPANLEPERVIVRTPDHSYDVLIGHNLIPTLARWIEDRPGTTPNLLLDSTVDQLHGPTIRAALGPIPSLTLPGGETSKNFASLATILSHLASTTPTHSTLLIVAGGGALGDVGGLSAALFLRGIPLVHLPTTLLAMVDSSIGGKTAIDLPEGKNLAGAFHQPALVLSDLAFLASLPPSDFTSGLGEVAKVAIGLDPHLLTLLESNTPALLARDPTLLQQTITRCVLAKAAIVQLDERDSDDRRLLNLGHTLAHALEAAAGFGPLRHGHAVALGLRFAIHEALRHATIDKPLAARFTALLDALHLPPKPPPLDPALVLLHLSRDKKLRNNLLHFVLPTGPGRCAVHPIPLPTLTQSVREFLAKP